MAPMPCDICDRPLTLQSGVLAYCYNDDRMDAVWGHEDCVPSLAYHVAFDRLLKEGMAGEKGWLTHLGRKVWFGADERLALFRTWTLAKELGALVDIAPPPPMRSVADMIPQHVPRTPKNPRKISTGTRTRVLERDGFRCRRCGNGSAVAPLVVDHIVPVARGGTGEYDNLQTLCQPCNAGKSDRDPTPHDLRAHA